MSRQTAVALAAVVGLLAGLGTLAGVVLALRDEGGGDDTPAIADTTPAETVETGDGVVTEPSPEELTVEVPVGGFPNAVAVGEGGVWVVRDGRRLIRVHPRRAEIVARIGAGDELGSERPCGVAVSNGAVWVTTLSGRVSRINPETNRLGALIETEDAACIAAGRPGVWVTAPNRGVVMRIDPATNDVVAEIPLEGFPVGIAIGFGSVWVATPDPPEGAEGAVSRIDPRSNEVVRTILVDNLPEFLAVAENAVWVTSNNGTVAEIDPRTNQVVETVRVTDGGRTSVAAGGGAVWATEIAGPGQEAPVVRIDPETAQVAGAVLERVRSPLGLAWGGGALWITSYEDGVVTRYEPLP